MLGHDIESEESGHADHRELTAKQFMFCPLPFVHLRAVSSSSHQNNKSEKRFKLFIK
ncbi:hypothetical protein YC2023_066965 [Brassica napus]